MNANALVYHITQILNCPVDALYNAVERVEDYPGFLPGCLRTRVLERSPEGLLADLTVGFGPFQETYRSKVHLVPFESIEVEYISGPFKCLKNYWKFKKLDNGHTEIEFFIEFEFKSKILHKLMVTYFSKGVSEVMGAFKRRATALEKGQAQCSKA